MKFSYPDQGTLRSTTWRIMVIVLLHVCSLVSARSIYVDNSLGNDSNDGTTWNTSYKTFKKACEMNGTDATIDKIYLAQGTYYPTGDQNGTDREITFHIKRGVSVYGGYPTGGAAMANPALYPTILSGNINNLNDKTDNSYHVVLIHGFSSGNVLMDGITIQEGRADGFGDTDFIRQYWGSAVHVDINSAVNLEFNRVNFKDSYVYDRLGQGQVGATVLVLGPTAKFNHCTFTGNEAGKGTAGVYASNASQFVNCLITGNKAPYATALRLFGQVELINSTIAGNIVTEYNGVVNIGNGPDFKVYNSIIYGNSSGVFINVPNTSIVRQHSLVQGLTDTSNGNLNGDLTNPSFKNALSPNSAPTSSGDYRLNDIGPCINTANISLLPTGFPTDLSGGPRVLRGGLDMGAYEALFDCNNSDLYVDAATAVNGNGSSWGNAIRELSEALSRAAVCPSVNRIFIAQGTYYPTGIQNGIKRDSAFLVTRGKLKIYGGYPTGGGTRNIQLYPTSLSGEIGSPATTSDNSLHVVVIAGVPADADSLVFNGLTVSNGNASETGTSLFNLLAVPNDLGGGISAMGNASNKIMLENVTVSNNTAARAGGMSVLSGTPVHLLRSRVLSNTADYAGGIQNRDISPATVATVTSSLIAGNSANTNGGGILNNNSKVSFTNSVLSGNKATSAGAVLNVTATTATFINCTIAGNLAGYAEGLGGGILDASSSKSYIYNTVIAGNNTGFFRDGGMVPEIHNSLIQGLTGTDNNNLHQNTNPDFTAPSAWQSAPSTAGDYRLLATSACIDKGDNTLLPLNIPTDYFWNARILGSAIDIGAMEWTCPAGNTLYVDAGVANSGNGSAWGNGMKTLIEAVAVASNCADIKEIRVAKGTYYPAPISTDTDRNRSFLIQRGGLKITGGYPTGGGTRDLLANPTILSGDIGVANDPSDNAHHVLTIVGIPSGADSLVLDGFSVTKGNANGSGLFQIAGVDVVRSLGGGLYLRGTGNGQKLTIRNCVFSDNEAQDGGGAVYIDNASPLFKQCDVLSNKTGGSGGGIRANSAAPLIINTKFRGNSATANGGGLINISSNSTVLNCAFTGNLGGLGGGIYNYTSSPVIINCVIAGNNATSSHGGAMYNTDGSFTILKNVIVYGNNSELFHSASTSNISNSLIQGLAGGTQGNLNGQTQNPGFVSPVAFNSAPTINGDYSQNASSPCIDAADYDALNPDITLDLAGAERFVGGFLDIGAYEYQSVACPAATELFVDNTAITGGNGSSWGTAFSTLKRALEVAKSCPNVQVIRVAKGTYYPNGIQGSKSRISTFHITRGGIKLIGGYPSGGGTRNISANETILSGNVGESGSSEDNTYHVILIVGVTLSDSIVVDGFTITGGNANTEASVNYGSLSVPGSQGGGLYVNTLTNASKFQVRNSTVYKNNAINFGGGMLLEGVNEPVSVTNTRFTENGSDQGGGIRLGAASLNITASRFSQNTAYQGGAISLASSNATILSTLFTGNWSYSTGSAIRIEIGSWAKLGNCTVADNSGATGKSVWADFFTGLTIHNSIIYGPNEGVVAGGNFPNFQGNLLTGMNGTSDGNIPGTTNPSFLNPSAGDYHLSPGSAAINAGLNNLATDFPTDLDGNTRIGSLRVDIGAYESLCSVTAAPDGTSITRFVGGVGQTYLFNACNLIAAVESQGGQAIYGQITATNRVKTDLVTYGNARFVRRHYELTPGTNPNAATAKVTLYFTKEDFEHYNENFGTGDNHKLPVEPSDNVSNLHIIKYAGSGNANGDPSSYGAQTIITPFVTWNAGIQLWEVKFDVAGFSGFFVSGQSSNPLPVVLSNVRATRQEQDVVLSWETLAEKDASHFEIERSYDARLFKTVGSVPLSQSAAGAIRNYSFVDLSPFTLGGTTIYYRLKMVDLDQSYAYSRILSVAGDVSTSELNIYPNPVSNGPVTIDVKSGVITRLEVFDLRGRTVPFVLKKIDNGKVTLKLPDDLTGTYLIRVENHGKKSVKTVMVE